MVWGHLGSIIFPLSFTTNFHRIIFKVCGGMLVVVGGGGGW